MAFCTKLDPSSILSSTNFIKLSNAKGSYSSCSLLNCFPFLLSRNNLRLNNHASSLLVKASSTVTQPEALKVVFLSHYSILMFLGMYMIYLLFLMFQVFTVPTKPIEGQKTGTSGLRKKVLPLINNLHKLIMCSCMCVCMLIIYSYVIYVISILHFFFILF